MHLQSNTVFKARPDAGRQCGQRLAISPKSGSILEKWDNSDDDDDDDADDDGDYECNMCRWYV